MHASESIVYNGSHKQWSRYFSHPTINIVFSLFLHSVDVYLLFVTALITRHVDYIYDRSSDRGALVELRERERDNFQLHDESVLDNCDHLLGLCWVSFASVLRISMYIPTEYCRLSESKNTGSSDPSKLSSRTATKARRLKGTCRVCGKISHITPDIPE